LTVLYIWLYCTFDCIVHLTVLYIWLYCTFDCIVTLHPSLPFRSKAGDYSNDGPPSLLGSLFTHKDLTRVELYVTYKRSSLFCYYIKLAIKSLFNPRFWLLGKLGYDKEKILAQLILKKFDKNTFWGPKIYHFSKYSFCLVNILINFTIDFNILQMQPKLYLFLPNLNFIL
jgi:hypothetical protein